METRVNEMGCLVSTFCQEIPKCPFPHFSLLETRIPLRFQSRLQLVSRLLPIPWKPETKPLEMKLALTPEQAAELEAVFAALDGGRVCVGQIRRSLHPNEDAGAFVLVYTLVSQQTGSKIRTAISRKRD